MSLNMVEEEDCRIPCLIARFCPCFKEELKEHYAKWKIDFPPKKNIPHPKLLSDLLSAKNCKNTGFRKGKGLLFRPPLIANFSKEICSCLAT